LLESVLKPSELQLSDVQEWAVHPGGRSILDKVETSLSLPKEALTRSRFVLKNYGNMSSATVLFVLKETLDQATTENALTCAMAFGPGLTVETAVMERLGGPTAKPQHEEEVSLQFESPLLETVMV
jgi:predicted naringenin-chalcone synthase